MVVELKDTDFVSAEETFRREHSAPARAKKVVSGPTVFARHATAARTADPVQVALTAASASLAMEAGKAYRLVASRALHFRMSKGAGTAVVTDIYLPAGLPITLATREEYDTLSVIKATGEADGIAQISEVK